MLPRKESPANSLARSRLWIYVAIGIGLTLISGILYGHYSLRWGPSANLEAAGKHLQTMPKQIGDWQLVKEYSMNERAVEVLDCAGYINRQYMNRQTGDMVDVAIITGPGGPISVHIAEVCFSSLAYDITEPRQKVFLSGSNSSKHSFWKVTFRSSNVVADALRVYYGWTTGDAWLASDQPRYDYAPNPILFKLQIAGSIPFEETSDDDPCLIFLQDLMGSDWTVAVK